ncbi:sulfotransferase family protein [Albibacillus kandeliae]|uniref:sulfotransferase family protein n=1 Tax=Albibacillus kandeliae TaxID=2174228 RepID=UPI000D68DCDD|nr:sulfotransferase family protein [Albibacillus kandeliae]
MTLRAVNLGLPKSGTTTLAKALRLSGMVVADHRLRGRNTKDPSKKGRYVADLLYRAYFDTGDPAALMPEVTAISEMSMMHKDRCAWPQTDFALIRAIRAHHPGVRFLASRREAFAMSQSMLAWSNLGTDRLPTGAVPGLPAGFGETSKERERWIDGHYGNLREWFAGDPDFLEFDIADPEAPNRISAFLGVDLPWWGTANANPLRRTS